MEKKKKSTDFKYLNILCVTVNYRGSTGFGQDTIESLLGNVGSQDVKDVQVCICTNNMYLLLKKYCISLFVIFVSRGQCCALYRMRQLSILIE